MRANLKNIFATDFANAVLPADDFNMERKKSEMYSEAKYKTLNQKNFRNDVLTPL